MSQFYPSSRSVVFARRRRVLCFPARTVLVLCVLSTSVAIHAQSVPQIVSGIALALDDREQMKLKAGGSSPPKGVLRKPQENAWNKKGGTPAATLNGHRRSRRLPASFAVGAPRFRSPAARRKIRSKHLRFQAGDLAHLPGDE